MAGNIAATFALGAVLGAGWVNSIGQAKKDISLLDRMSTGLNAQSAGSVRYDPPGLRDFPQAPTHAFPAGNQAGNFAKIRQKKPAKSFVYRFWRAFMVASKDLL